MLYVCSQTIIIILQIEKNIFNYFNCIIQKNHQLSFKKVKWYLNPTKTGLNELMTLQALDNAINIVILNIFRETFQHRIQHSIWIMVNCAFINLIRWAINYYYWMKIVFSQMMWVHTNQLIMCTKYA